MSALFCDLPSISIYLYITASSHNSYKSYNHDQFNVQINVLRMHPIWCHHRSQIRVIMLRVPISDVPEFHPYVRSVLAKFGGRSNSLIQGTLRPISNVRTYQLANSCSAWDRSPCRRYNCRFQIDNRWEHVAMQAGCNLMRYYSETINRVYHDDHVT